LLARAYVPCTAGVASVAMRTESPCVNICLRMDCTNTLAPNINKGLEKYEST
jgi:hypothetical protein